MRSILPTCALLLTCAATLAQSIPCESLGGTYRECRIATSGRVRLVFELSERACFEGVSWGTSSDGVVWVDRGCRARFTVDTPSESRAFGGKRVVCESLTGDPETCRADGSRGIELARQLSRKACVKDESWGYDDALEQIWVDRGCRGEFILGKLIEPALPAEPLGAIVACESVGGRRSECHADTAAGVQIVRELGEKPCRFGREWGFDKKEIWVAKGCRAEFAVRGKPAVSTVVCESQGDTRSHCAAETEFGIALVKMLGESQCILGTTWGFDDEGVWVSGGCRAQFALGGFRLPVSAIPASALRITCESALGIRNQCAVDTVRGVGLVHEIGKSPCVLNRTWGYGAEGIWVSDGCSAEFVVAR